MEDLELRVRSTSKRKRKNWSKEEVRQRENRGIEARKKYVKEKMEELELRVRSTSKEKMEELELRVRSTSKRKWKNWSYEEEVRQRKNVLCGRGKNVFSAWMKEAKKNAL